MSGIEPRHIPLDFSNLDLRFLPYYLTAERVKIKWRDDQHENWILERNVDTFYIGIELVSGFQYDNDDIEPHLITFNRLRNKNTINGLDIDSDIIEDVHGLGMRNPLINPETSIEKIIDIKLHQLLAVTKVYERWMNYRGFVEAYKEIKNNEY